MVAVNSLLKNFKKLSICKPSGNHKQMVSDSCKNPHHILISVHRFFLENACLGIYYVINLWEPQEKALVSFQVRSLQQPLQRSI